MRLFFALALCAVIAGCAAPAGPGTYSAASTGRIGHATPGVVVSARLITIKSGTGTGGLVGGVAGAVAGSAIGGGNRVPLLGALGGAVAGAALGNAIESGNARSVGMEYVIQTSSGRLLTIAQGTPPLFQEGDRVLILDGLPARVIADNRLLM